MVNPASELATVTVIGDIDSTLTGISGEMLAWRKSEALGEHFYHRQTLLALDHDPASGTKFTGVIFILSFFFRLSLSDLRGSAKQLHRGGAVAFLLPTKYANDSVAARTQLLGPLEGSDSG